MNWQTFIRQEAAKHQAFKLVSRLTRTTGKKARAKIERQIAKLKKEAGL